MAAGTYWVGQNGQVYVQGDQGTNAAGAYDANTETGDIIIPLA